MSNRPKLRRRTPSAPAPASPAPSLAQRGLDHPLGPAVGVYRTWQEGMKVKLLEIMEENRRALESCTREPDCPNSVHYPDCWVAG